MSAPRLMLKDRFWRKAISLMGFSERAFMALLYGPAAFHNGFGAVTEVAHMYPAY